MSVYSIVKCYFKTGGPGAVLCFLLTACLLSGLVSGCAVGQNYRRPQVNVPDKWRVGYSTAARLANTAWWRQFRDPALDKLIRVALNENRDVRAAAARVEAFKGRLQSVESGFYPQVGYAGIASRDSQSLERPVPQLVRGADRANSTYETTLGINWEMDIWGRLRRETEAARADLLAAKEGRQAVILSLVSDVATGYIKLLSMDKQLAIARKTSATWKSLLQLFENKFKGGQVSGLELAQVRSAYEQVALYVPDIERRIALQENALSILVGRNPGTIRRDKTLDGLIMPKVPAGIPSDLLEQRPDIRQSEEELIAANARIGVARSRYFPDISLTGLFGYASSALSKLFTGPANLWQAGAGAAGTVFSGGRIQGGVREAEARQKELLNDYLKTIQTAFGEVDDSLIDIQKLREILKIQARHIKALRDNARFARARYDEKLASYLEVVDAERGLFAAQLSYVDKQNDLFAALVDCYKAMGGGWVAKAAGEIAPPGRKKGEKHGAG